VSARERLAGHIPAALLDTAAEVMGAAEVYASTGTYPDGFPVPARQLEAAAQLVRVGLLAEVGRGRFALAPSREFVL